MLLDLRWEDKVRLHAKGSDEKEREPHLSGDIGMEFEVLARDGNTKARLGLIKTSRGEVRTPAFLPVGTRGTVKAMAPWELEEIGFEMVLTNLYHLYLRPGLEIIREAGGLHGFTGWERPILTDSGGFQVFSLSRILKVEEEGVRFRSVYDGSEVFLTPEEVVRAQEALGSDIAVVLDYCVGYPTSEQEAERGVKLTGEWARRSLAVRSPTREQAFFGVVQGGTSPRLRSASAEELAGMDFDGYCIGGLSVGEPRELMLECVEVQTGILPEGKPRHLLGVGDPLGLVTAVALGVDLFDCVLPTRLARTGVALTQEGRLNLRNSRFARDHGPLEEGCPCPACRRFSRAYLRHLHKVGEILAHRLLTWHNLQFMQGLLLDCRKAIAAGRMNELISRCKEWDRAEGEHGEGSG
jgi:queuine tRNA-ribosyltransferase